MKSLHKLSILILILTVISTAASAYTLFSEGNNVRVRQWPPSSDDGTLTSGGIPDAALPAQWRLNTAGSDNVSFPVLSTIVDDTITTFNNIPGAPTLYGREADTPNDSFTTTTTENTISFIESNWTGSTGAGSTVLAFARGSSFTGGPFENYQAQNDIVFNGETHTWSDAGANTTFDIQSVLTHEMGHATGLDHTTILGATMFPTSPSIGQAGAPGTRARTLAADDISGAQSIYGAPATDGSISGTIASDIGGQGMGVVAINLTTGESYSALTGNGINGTANGLYVIDGLPAGDYHVATYPVDDAGFGFTATNVQQFTNIDAVFEPRMYDSTATGTSDPASASTVTVIASSTTANIDINPPAGPNTENLYFANNNTGFAPGGANIPSNGDDFHFGFSDQGAISTPQFAGPSGTTLTSTYRNIFFSNAGIFGENVGIYRSNVTSTNATAGALRTLLINYNGTSNLEILPGAVELDFAVTPMTPPDIDISGSVNIAQDTSLTPNLNLGTVTDVQDVDSTIVLAVTNISPAPPTAADLTLTVVNTAGDVILTNIAATCDLPAATYTVTVEARDSDAQNDTDTFNVIVSANTAPALAAYTPAAPITIGGSRTNTPASAPSDAEGNIVSVSINPTDFGGMGSVSVAAATGEVSFNTTVLTAPANYSFTVTAVDDCGLLTTTLVTQQVNGIINLPPVVVISGTSNIDQGQSLTPNQNLGTVTDPEDADSSVNLVITQIIPPPPSPSDLQIGLTNSGGNVILSTLQASCDLPTGTYAVSVVGRDSSSLLSLAVGVFTVTVGANDPPVMGAYPATTPQLRGTTGITVTPASPPVDPQDNLTSVTITPSDFAGTGSATVNQATGIVTLDSTLATPVNDYTFSVVLTDSCGLVTTETLTQRITNTLPVISVAGAPAITQDQVLPLNLNLGNVSDAEDSDASLAVTVSGITPTPPAPADLIVELQNVAGDVILTTLTATCDLPATTYAVTLQVEDSGAGFTTDSISVIVGPNTAPTLDSYTPGPTVLAGTAGIVISPSLPPSDAEANLASVSITPTDFSGTGSASVDFATGDVTFNTVLATPASNYSFSIVATDNCGLVTTQTLTQDVITNSPPTLTISGTVSTSQDVALTPGLNLGTISDVEDLPNVLGLAVSNINPSPPSPVDLEIGVLNVFGSVLLTTLTTTCDLPATTYTVTLTATDTGLLTNNGTFLIVVDENTTPTLGVYPPLGSVPASTTGITVTPATPPSDTEGNIVSVAINPADFGGSGSASVDPVTGIVFLDTSAATLPGTYAFTVSITDNCGLLTTQGLTQQVTNNLPVISIAGTATITQDESLNPALNLGTVSDIEDTNSTLPVSVSSISPVPPTPADLIVGIENIAGDVILTTLTATCDLPATTYTVTLRTADSQADSAIDTFEVVVDANTTPTLGIYPSTIAVSPGTTGIIVTPASPPADADGNISSVVISPTDFGGTGSATVDALTGIVTLDTDALTTPSTYAFTVTVTDSCGLLTSQSLTQEVLLNTPPVLTIGGLEVISQGVNITPGTNLGVVMDLEDSDGLVSLAVTGISPAPATPADLVIGLSNNAGNVFLNSIDASCALSTGTYTIEVTATDSLLSNSAPDTFQIQVDANTSPTLGLYPATTTVTAATTGITVTPASPPVDLNNNIASVTITPTDFGGNGSATVDPVSGVVTLDTSSATLPGNYSFVVSVVDNCGLFTTRSLSQQVDNNPPMIVFTGNVNTVQGEVTTFNQSIGTVSDVETFDGLVSLTVTIIPPPPSPADLVIGLTNSAGDILVSSVFASCSLPNGLYTISVTATDGFGATDTDSFGLGVFPNPAPSLGFYPNPGPVVQSLTTIQVFPTGPPNDVNNNIATVTVTPSVIPGGGTVTVDPTTGVLTFNILPITTPGNFGFTITVTDDCGEFTLQTVFISVLMNTTIDEWENWD